MPYFQALEIGHFYKGLGLGLAIAAPVGPIALLCIRRTLTQGPWVGLVTGLGAATADGLYATVAAFGLTALVEPLLNHHLWLRLGGGLGLVYLGIATLVAKPSQSATPVSPASLLGAYGSTLLLTLSNPVTILSFMAIFAGLGLGSQGKGWLTALSLVLGVVGGSALWWLGLTWGVTWWRPYFTPQRLGWCHGIAGIALFSFGLVTLFHS